MSQTTHNFPEGKEPDDFTPAFLLGVAVGVSLALVITGLYFTLI